MVGKTIAYLRVSSVGQGTDGCDGFPRQRAAVARRAKVMGLELVEEFADEGVSGTLPPSERPGLSGLFERVLGNGSVDGDDRARRTAAEQVSRSGCPQDSTPLDEAIVSSDAWC